MEKFTLGLVGPPFGLKGFVKVKSLSGETDHFFKLKNVILRKNDKEDLRNVSEAELKGQNLLIRFEGIDNPEDAALINGSEIITDREYAAPLNEGEFYVEDMIGLEVFTPLNEKIGKISAIIEGGGGNLAEIERLSGEKCFIPFRKEFFDEPDFENSRIILLEPWVIE